MLAKNARENACDVIWAHLPSKIRFAIEDAVSEGKLNCEIRFSIEETNDFNECIEYFYNLNKLGYETAMHKEYVTGEMEYVITIIW